MTEKFQDKYRISSARLRNWDYSAEGIYFITICTTGHECYFGRIVNKKMVLSDIGSLAQLEWEKSFIIRAELFCDYFVIMPNHIHAILRIENGVCEQSLHDRITHNILHGNDVETDGRSIKTDERPAKTDGRPVETDGRPSLQIPNRPSEISNRPYEIKNHPSEISNRPYEIKNRPSEIPNRPSEIPNRPYEIPNRPAEIPNFPYEIKNHQSEQPSNLNLIIHQEPDGRPALHHDIVTKKQILPSGFGVAYRPPKSISSFVAGFKSVVTVNARKIHADFGWQTRFHDHIIHTDPEYQRIADYIENNPANWEKDKFFKD